MANKRTRLDVLRRLFENNSYDNQVDILNDLKNEGFMLAQPTLSRDMRQLKVSRIYNKDGKTVYVLPNEKKFNHVSHEKRRKEKVTQSFGFLSLSFSGNIAVVKTLHGYANSLAAEIDEFEVPEVLGSLAGDDTILLVLKEGASREAVRSLIRNIVPGYDEE